MGRVTGDAGRVAGLTMTCVAAVSAIALQSPAAAIAAAAPPKITSAFTPNLIGVGGTTDTALSVTITNPNSSGTLSSIAFTDTLPSSLSIDNPNGENGACGSSGVITDSPGSQTFSLSGGSLKAGASCTLSVSLIASQAGVVQNNTGPVSSSAGSSASGDTETLTVLPPPTVSVSHIKNNARYTYGEVVRPTYSCAQPADAQALEDCSAVDDVGNNIRSGGALETKSPGSHNLTVSATSADGLVTSDTINYTVLPDNVFTIAKLKPQSGGTVSFALVLPGPGKVKAVELSGKRTVSTYTRTVDSKRTIEIHLRPTAAGKTLLGTGVTKVGLQVIYTPKGGQKRTVTKRGIALS